MTEHATLADCLVVVPMKDPARAKTRLSDALSVFDRQSLAWHLYRGTLHVLRSVRRHTRIDLAVVTGNRDISNHGAEAGIAVIPEGPEASLTGAVQSAAAWASAQGYARLCVLPADLAAPKASDIDAVLLRPQIGDQAHAMRRGDRSRSNPLAARKPEDRYRYERLPGARLVNGLGHARSEPAR